MEVTDFDVNSDIADIDFSRQVIDTSPIPFNMSTPAISCIYLTPTPSPTPLDSNTIDFITQLIKDEMRNAQQHQQQIIEQSENEELKSVIKRQEHIINILYNENIKLTNTIQINNTEPNKNSQLQNPSEQIKNTKNKVFATLTEIKNSMRSIY